MGKRELLALLCLTGLLWLFVFCCYHLDGEERNSCFTLSVLLVSCNCLFSVAFILMGKRELVALLWESFRCLVTICVLLLSSWWGRESRLLYCQCLSDVLWLFVFSDFNLDGEERVGCFTLSVLLVSCDFLCSVAFILMRKRELFALLWVYLWCLVTVCVLWRSSWWEGESRLLYFECLTGVLWLFVFCGFHLDEEERAACISLSVLLVSCDFLFFVAFILMGKREPVALLWVSYWLVYYDCLCSVAFILMGKRELVALRWESFRCLVTICVLLLSSWWGRESRLLCFECLSDVLWLFVFSDFNLDGEERDGCFTLSTWLVSCDCLYPVPFILMGKRELVASLWVSFWCLVTVCVIWLFLTMTLVGLRCVIVVFPDHTDFLFIWYLQSLIVHASHTQKVW